MGITKDSLVHRNSEIHRGKNANSSLIIVPGSHLHPLNSTLRSCGSWLNSILGQAVVFEYDANGTGNPQSGLSGKEAGCKMQRARINWNPQACGRFSEDRPKPTSLLVSSEVSDVNVLLKLGIFVMEINIYTQSRSWGS